LADINWEAVSAIGSILGAAASTAAVITALYLASRTNRPSLGIEELLRF